MLGRILPENAGDSPSGFKMRPIPRFSIPTSNALIMFAEENLSKLTDFSRLVMGFLGGEDAADFAGESTFLPVLPVLKNHESNKTRNKKEKNACSLCIYYLFSPL
jgi:hypothetical protein